MTNNKNSNREDFSRNNRKENENILHMGESSGGLRVELNPQQFHVEMFNR
jgi:hypothetical protein